MTLIAYKLNYGTPFIVGDLLISSKAKNPPFILPTAVSSIDNLLSSDITMFPQKLNQKVYIIRENLCVALAGDVLEMKSFLSELKIRCSYYNPVKKEHILQFLDNHEISGDFAGILVFIENPGEDSGIVYKFTYGDWVETESYHFQSALATGSGAHDYLTAIDEQDEFEGELDENELKVGDPHHALTANYCLIAKLLGEERYSLRTVNSYWGAGFETIFYDGKSFRKFDDITYVIWYSKLDEELNFSPGPTLVLHFKYYGEILLITSIQKSDQRSYRVLPIDLQDDTEFSNSSDLIPFESARIVNCYVVEKEDRKHTTITAFVDNLGMKVSFTEGKLKITKYEELENYIFSKIEEKFI